MELRCLLGRLVVTRHTNIAVARMVDVLLLKVSLSMISCVIFLTPSLFRQSFSERTACVFVPPQGTSNMTLLWSTASDGGGRNKSFLTLSLSTSPSSPRACPTNMSELMMRLGMRALGSDLSEPSLVGGFFPWLWKVHVCSIFRLWVTPD